MKYTSRLRLALAADIIFITALAVVFILVEKDMFNNFGILLTAVTIPGLLCVFASLNKDSGECGKWHKIWKTPIWQTIGYIVLAAALIISIFIFPKFEYTGVLVACLIMAYCLIRDIRYYRNAVRFDMDDLNDVNELVSKHPEARPMINRNA